MLDAAVDRTVRVDPEAVDVDPCAGERSQSSRPFNLVLREHGATGLADIVLSHRTQPLPCLGVVETDVGNIVVAELNADRVLDRSPAPSIQSAMTDFHSADETAVGLMKLVAVHGIVQKEREV